MGRFTERAKYAAKQKARKAAVNTARATKEGIVGFVAGTLEGGFTKGVKSATRQSGIELLGGRGSALGSAVDATLVARDSKGFQATPLQRLLTTVVFGDRATENVTSNLGVFTCFDADDRVTDERNGYTSVELHRPGFLPTPQERARIIERARVMMRMEVEFDDDGVLRFAPLGWDTHVNAELARATKGDVLAKKHVSGTYNLIGSTFIPVSVDEAFDLPTLARKVRKFFPGKTIVGIREHDEDNGTYLVELNREGSRPRHYDADELEIGEGVKAERINAYAEDIGKHLIRFDGVRNRAFIARLDPATAQLRDRFASLMKIAPWDLDIALHASGITAEGEDPHLDGIDIRRIKLGNVDGERRAETIRNLLASIDSRLYASWKVSEDVTGSFTLKYAPPPKLTREEGFNFDQLERPWDEFELGTLSNRKPFVLRLGSNPHSIIAGKTNSGKSVMLNALMATALAKGWDVALVDAAKQGLDFAWAKQWIRPEFWGGHEDYESVVAALLNVYAEVVRRRAILAHLGVEKRTALPADKIVEYGMNPVLVVVDEFASTVLPLDVAGPKDDPERVANEAINYAKNRIRTYVGKLLREARFVGVHVAIGTQSWNVSLIGSGAGEFRTNAGNRVQIGGANSTALGMIAEDVEDAKAAYMLAHKLASTEDIEDEGRAIPGRGIAEINGVGTVALQGAKVEAKDLTAWLESLNLPKYQAAPLPMEDAEKTLPASLLIRRTADGVDVGGAQPKSAPGERVKLAGPDSSVFNLWDWREHRIAAAMAGDAPAASSEPASPAPDTIIGPADAPTTSDVDDDPVAAYVNHMSQTERKETP